MLMKANGRFLKTPMRPSSTKHPLTMCSASGATCGDARTVGARPTPLTGLMYCADCGGKMYVHRTNNGKRIPQYICSQYSKVPVGTLCPTQQSSGITKKKKQLVEARKRSEELEKLLCQIYEDKILGKLPEARFVTLDARYADEQDELSGEIEKLEQAVSGYERKQQSAEKFIALIDKYENFEILTTTMLNEFVEKIVVHERDHKGCQDTRQEVEIYFNFVGKYVPRHFGEVSLTPEGQEVFRKKEERQDRLHWNYLRRKANGKQKEYEERVKNGKQQKIEAPKAALHVEDVAKGVFVPASMLPKTEPKKAPLPVRSII